jgi:hypothetical protein
MHSDEQGASGSRLEVEGSDGVSITMRFVIELGDAAHKRISIPQSPLVERSRRSPMYSTRRLPWASSTAPNGSGMPQPQRLDGDHANASANTSVSAKDPVPVLPMLPMPAALPPSPRAETNIATDSTAPGHWTQLPLGNPPPRPGLKGPRHFGRTPRCWTKIILRGVLGSRFVSRPASCSSACHCVKYILYVLCYCPAARRTLLDDSCEHPPRRSVTLCPLSRYPLRASKTSALPRPRLSSLLCRIQGSALQPPPQTYIIYRGLTRSFGAASLTILLRPDRSGLFNSFNKRS